MEALLRRANASPRAMLALVCLLMAAPALATAWRAWHGRLGVNGVEVLIQKPGTWSMILLLAALSIGPARRLLLQLAVLYRCGYGKRLPDWNWLLRLRRPVGLASSFYALAHCLSYLWLDLGWDWRAGAVEALAKPFIGTGLLALLLLLPLAITSTDGWMRRLKRNWKNLHMLVYPAAGAALIHVILLTKPGVPTPYAYGGVLMTLLAYRVLQRRAQDLPAQDRADGTVAERCTPSHHS